MTATHEVFNQAAPRVDVNEYLTDLPLVEAVEAYGASWATDQLTEAGALVGRADFQRDAELANTITPKLHTHDRWGHR
ncbi:MAG: DNA alkylation response protein, partial [Gordonia sp. (in: high G+C Gram-positive bacteria)]|nr:DNA alkylation response protein [Gordonia sp. (in: high G+C Gram-positive bacteria)]